MIKLFLKLRGTPVVIVTDEFQGWEGIKETFYFFMPAQPEIPRVPVGRPPGQIRRFIYLIIWSKGLRK